MRIRCSHRSLKNALGEIMDVGGAAVDRTRPKEIHNCGVNPKSNRYRPLLYPMDSKDYDFTCFEKTPGKYR